MEKLLFIIPEFLHGGTNKCLENLLSYIDTKYAISIYCLNEHGPYLDIFKKYNIVKKTIWGRIIFDYYLTSRVISRIDPFFYRLLSHWFYQKEADVIMYRYSFPTVIAFQESTTTIFGSFFHAKKKIAWCHCDYTLYLKGTIYSEREEKRAYQSYDTVVNVSKCTAQVMKEYFPEIEDRITYVYNLLNPFLVEKEAQQEPEGIVNDTELFKIVSIGRLSPVKRFKEIPRIVKNIIKKKSSSEFIWYIIGGGEEKATIQKEIDKYEVGAVVKMLGSKNNPYPYIKRSNLLACLSESESWSYVINEAKLLNVPVITTDFEVAFEVVNEDNGIICSFEQFSEKLYDLISDKNEQYSSLLSNCQKYKYDNGSIVGKLHQIFQNC